MTLDLSIHRDDDRVTVTPRGDIDLSTVEALRAAITAAIDKAVAVQVNLAEVTFIDSAGINCMLQAKRLADVQAVRFGVTGATGLIHEVLELTGVLTHLTNPPA